MCLQVQTINASSSYFEASLGPVRNVSLRMERYELRCAIAQVRAQLLEATNALADMDELKSKLKGAIRKGKASDEQRKFLAEQLEANEAKLNEAKLQAAELQLYGNRRGLQNADTILQGVGSESKQQEAKEQLAAAPKESHDTAAAVVPAAEDAAHTTASAAHQQAATEATAQATELLVEPKAVKKVRLQPRHFSVITRLE